MKLRTDSRHEAIAKSGKLAQDCDGAQFRFTVRLRNAGDQDLPGLYRWTGHSGDPALE